MRDITSEDIMFFSDELARQGKNLAKELDLDYEIELQLENDIVIRLSTVVGDQKVGGQYRISRATLEYEANVAAQMRHFFTSFELAVREQRRLLPDPKPA